MGQLGGDKSAPDSGESRIDSGWVARRTFLQMSAPSARIVIIKAQPIELCQLLKFSGLAATGGEAKHLISEGQVLLNGIVETQKRKKVMGGDKVTFGGETIIAQVD